MIFADSSFFIGLADRKDQWQKKALRVARGLDEDIVVSDLVISESVTSIGSRAGGKAGMKLYDYFSDNCKVVYTDDDLLDEAMRTFLKYDGKLSVADSVSVTIMKRMNIHRIVSFDSDFDRVAGVVRLK